MSHVFAAEYNNANITLLIWQEEGNDIHEAWQVDSMLLRLEGRRERKVSEMLPKCKEKWRFRFIPLKLY